MRICRVLEFLFLNPQLLCYILQNETRRMELRLQPIQSFRLSLPVNYVRVNQKFNRLIIGSQ